MEDVFIPVSPGELLDKITILRIKAVHITNPVKLVNVHRELALLEEVWCRVMPQGQDIGDDLQALENANAKLWDIEDRIREHEAAHQFDTQFIALARAVYVTNDERAAIKRRINVVLNSGLVEEKSYSADTPRANLVPTGVD